ncbi:MAG: FISUMP domain-containing protein, partial [Candidatus Saccharibacteria bacterium]|nr:FISUMP domain-containing protein [Candidatus Saccharibacteria bacterium]
GKTYTVRYINGNCWMTQNLAYDLTDKTFEINGTQVTAKDDMSDSYTAPHFHIPTEDELGSLTKQEIGIYYNYCAATAGEVCNYSSFSGAITATSSICPAGWSLPKEEQISTIKGEHSPGVSIPGEVEKFTPVESGRIANGKIFGVGTNGGIWWSSKSNGDSSSYLSFFKGVIQNGGGQRNYSFSIRCTRSE